MDPVIANDWYWNDITKEHAQELLTQGFNTLSIQFNKIIYSTDLFTLFFVHPQPVPEAGWFGSLIRRLATTCSGSTTNVKSNASKSFAMEIPTSWAAVILKGT